MIRDERRSRQIDKNIYSRLQQSLCNVRSWVRTQYELPVPLDGTSKTENKQFIQLLFYDSDFSLNVHRIAALEDGLSQN